MAKEPNYDTCPVCGGSVNTLYADERSCEKLPGACPLSTNPFTLGEWNAIHDAIAKARQEGRREAYKELLPKSKELVAVGLTHEEVALINKHFWDLVEGEKL